MTTAPLILLGALMAVVVGFLFRQTLHVRPWVEEQNQVLKLHGEGQFFLPAKKVGLGVFLCVVGALFSLFISAYYMRMQHGIDWVALPAPRELWLTSGVLVLASVAMEWTRQAAKRGERSDLRNGLIAGGILTWLFLAGQLWVWQLLVSGGHYASSSPANGFFYLLTAVHGLHILGGLWVWARTSYKVWRGAEVEDVRMSVELCTTYWHFLLIVWLALFAVLSYAPAHLGHH